MAEDKQVYDIHTGKMRAPNMNNRTERRAVESHDPIAYGGPLPSDRTVEESRGLSAADAGPVLAFNDVPPSPVLDPIGDAMRASAPPPDEDQTLVPETTGEPETPAKKKKDGD